MAQQILKLTDDTALAEATKAEGQRRLKTELSWEREQAELLALYERVLQGKPAPVLATEAA